MLVDPGVFNKTIIQLGLAGYKMIITSAALRASLVISITSYTVRPPRINVTSDSTVSVFWSSSLQC